MDDTHANRYIRGRLLRSEGFEVIEAATGSAALKLAAEKHPSLILLDIQLPDINGFAVCRRLKSNPKTAQIPVLHISSLGKHDHEYPEALESGAEAYLQEPVEPSILIAVITALIRAAAAEGRARKTERDAVDILESIGEAMYLLDQDYRYTYVNAEAERLTGMPRESLIGRAHDEVFPESIGTTIDREYKRVMAERTPSSFENYYEPWQKWFEVKASPVSGGGIAVHFRDITGRKQAEAERQRLARDLAERSGELQAILDAAPVAIWIAHDTQCLRITGNVYADQAIMRVPRHGNISRSARPDDAALSYRAFRDGVELRPDELPAQVAISTGKPVTPEELDLLFPDGRTLCLFAGAVPLFDAEGRVRGSIVAGADVTQLCRAQEALEKQRASLEATALFPQQNPSPVLRIHEDGTLLYANPSSKAPIAEWGCEVGQTVPDFLRHAVEHALAQGAPADLEIRIVGRDYLFIVAPIQDSRYANLYGRDITERKRAEQALLDSEERFRTLVRASSDVLYCMAPDWTEMRQLGGGKCIPDQERPSKNWLQEYIHPGDQPEVLKAIHKAVQTKSVFELEHRVRRVDGSLGWTFSRAIPVMDANGEVVEWFGAATDISQRKLAEEALRESEERFRILADGCPAIIWVSDAEGGNRFVNRAYREFFGVTYTEVEGRKWRPFIHPDDELEYVGAVLHGVRERVPIRAEARVRRADGEWRWIASYAEPRFSPSGEFIGHAGISPDITDRKRAEQALAGAVQRLNAHMDNSPLAVVEFDPQFRVTRWSKEAEKIFGWSGEEILGRAINEMRWVHEDDVEAVVLVAQDMLSGQRPRNVSVNRNYRKDGSVLELEWYNSAIYDGQGQLASILSQVLDVTDRSRTEERLRQAQKMESIALLAGGVAHDFNNLLVGVIGNASLAIEMLPPESPAADLLERIIKSGEQAAHLTKQMLAYSGKGRFVMEPVDLSDLIREVTDLVRSTAPKKIAMQLDLEPAIPSIKADRGQIHQVLMNLVINATEAIGNETGLIAVQTGVQSIDEQVIRELEGWDITPGDYVFLEVRDTGCGMDEATRARIFDPFFTTKFQGRGLGLAAVAGIVRGHKGAIRVRTAPGRGTSFHLLFPAMDSEPAVRAATGSRAEEQDLKTNGAILVVDDEEAVRHITQVSLERRGCEVLAASSGFEAMALLAQNADTIALVILDLSMPGMSGREVLPKLLAINPRLDVIVSSGYAEADALRLFDGMPVAGFIQKPYTVQRLVATVKMVLDRKNN
ncbi:MAG TPA: PAS domain S-box protein [Bryobacteraceae bacterium]|nr:PAS domain S-box protein [Bryobacteraceae bacterium]